MPYFSRSMRDKPAGQTLCRGSDQREVEVVFLGCLIHALTHVADDLKAQVLRFVALAVVYADQRLQALCQTDEADASAFRA